MRGDGEQFPSRAGSAAYAGTGRDAEGGNEALRDAPVRIGTA